MAAPSTFTFQLPGELEKESKAKEGITKLMLLDMCASMDSWWIELFLLLDTHFPPDYFLVRHNTKYKNVLEKTS